MCENNLINILKDFMGKKTNRKAWENKMRFLLFYNIYFLNAIIINENQLILHWFKC